MIVPTKVYNKLRPQDHLGTLIRDDVEEERGELPASATLKQFRADQEAQEELEELFSIMHL